LQVPKQLYQLTNNYRSHSGILHLASSVVDLLVEFFPESFDRLERDLGLFAGPRPVLLEGCSFGDLALLLRGNRRQSSHIEFGAHQAILVPSEEARKALPRELEHALTLTIFESKGLEFNDVLLFNFFKYSQVQAMTIINV
jgi:ATP-dependent exoDNAse (exonuclease V) beta subunit